MLHSENASRTFVEQKATMLSDVGLPLPSTEVLLQFKFDAGIAS